AVSIRLIPDTANSRVDYHEGGILSVNREYLRVTRGAHSFDICGAPFGTGFFVSTWLVEERNSLSLFEIAAILLGAILLAGILVYELGFALGMLFTILGIAAGGALLVTYLNSTRPGWDDFLVKIPFFGPIYQQMFRPMTYYKLDTAQMF